MMSSIANTAQGQHVGVLFYNKWIMGFEECNEGSKETFGTYIYNEGLQDLTNDKHLSRVKLP